MIQRRTFVGLVLEHSLLLPAGAIVALLWANISPGGYYTFAHRLEFYVNDIGMVFFFALATKEIVEATAPGGALHTWRRAALPAAAAIGGMIVPALMYVAYVAADQAVLRRGWAIPCATDIAFSLLTVRWIFRRHPAIPFLLLLAIADDALGLIVLALFYPVRELHIVVAVVLMAIALGVAVVFRHRHLKTFWPYVIVGGAISWAALFWGGLHPALALVPIVPFLPHGARDPGLFVPAPAAARDALSQFEHWLKVPVQAVLFLFGLVNAGVQIGAAGAGTWGVLLALVVGKPLGVGVAVAVAVAVGLRLPQHLGWRDVVVVGCAAGIGFTVALFFATAAFPTGPLLAQTKVGALLSLSSAAVAVVAAWILRVGRFTASRAEGL